MNQAKEKKYETLKKKLSVTERAINTSKQMKERLLINFRSIRNATEEKLKEHSENISEKYE